MGVRMQLLLLFFFLLTFTGTFIVLFTHKKDKSLPEKRDVNLERDKAEIDSYLRELRALQFQHEDARKKIKQG